MYSVDVRSSHQRVLSGRAAKVRQDRPAAAETTVSRRWSTTMRPPTPATIARRAAIGRATPVRRGLDRRRTPGDRATARLPTGQRQQRFRRSRYRRPRTRRRNADADADAVRRRQQRSPMQRAERPGEIRRRRRPTPPRHRPTRRPPTNPPQPHSTADAPPQQDAAAVDADPGRGRDSRRRRDGEYRPRGHAGIRHARRSRSRRRPSLPASRPPPTQPPSAPTGIDRRAAAATAATPTHPAATSRDAAATSANRRRPTHKPTPQPIRRWPRRPTVTTPRRCRKPRRPSKSARHGANADGGS